MRRRQTRFAIQHRLVTRAIPVPDETLPVERSKYRVVLEVGRKSTNSRFPYVAVPAVIRANH